MSSPSDPKTASTSDALLTFTSNGDVTFSTMGAGPAAALMELDQAMVRVENGGPKYNAVAMRGRGRGRGRAARGRVPKQEQKAEKVDVVGPLKATIDSRFERFQQEVASLDSAQQAHWWSLMLRYAFFLRNVRGEGKRERAFFYYLFQKLAPVFPRTCAQLTELVPNFGYFKDLENLITEFSALPAEVGAGICTAALECLRKHLDADVQAVFGRPLAEVQAADAEALNTRLKAMSRQELSEFTKGKKLSLVAKWLSREDKSEKDDKANKDKEAAAAGEAEKPRLSPRDLFIRHAMLAPGALDDAAAAPARLNYAQMRLRKILTALTQCLRVCEQLMCAVPDQAKGIRRNWADIDIASTPAAAVTKYRKAFLNISLTAPPRGAEQATGNRYPDRADRVACRQHTLKSLLEGKLKGASLDLSKLSRLIYEAMDRASFVIPPEEGEDPVENVHEMDGDEMSILDLQWKQMVNDLKAKITEAVGSPEALKEAGAIDPRNVIPIVDTSGSMGAADVQHVAIGLGVMAASLSNTPGAIITFSERPEAIVLDLSKPVFDQFRQIKEGPMGFTTNVDATYRLLLDMMEGSSVAKAEYAIMFLTDGQFDCSLVNLNLDASVGVGGSEVDQFQTVFLDRMEAAFNDKGYTLPRTIFWNLNAQGAGFMGKADTKGIQLLSGFSQTLMQSVFTGDYKTIDVAEEAAPDADEAAAGGAEPQQRKKKAGRVNVDPFQSFIKPLRGDTFAPIVSVALETREGVFGALSAETASVLIAEAQAPADSSASSASSSAPSASSEPASASASASP